MSASSELPEHGKKMTRKISFNQRCSLFSQYLKEKGSFGDLTLADEQNAVQTDRQLRPVATTMDLFPAAEKLGQASILTKSVSMELFPREETLPKMSDHPDSGQMTIFYGGQVIVFQGFSTDKAKAIIELARKPSSNLAQKSSHQHGEPVACLPMAPRASLRRFLEKRKDRLKAKAPYLVGSSADQPSGATPWLGLSAQ